MPRKDPEARKQYYHEYDAIRYAVHPEEIRARVNANYAAHPEKGRAKSVRYRATHKGAIRVRCVAYKETHLDKVRSENARAVAKLGFRRRDLGLNPLNSYFPGSEAHHINRDDVIYIPKEMHRSVSHNQWTGKNMERINALAFAWYTKDGV